ncbi:hypothetical protein [Marinicella meishanensis]|uniref:hypothetical protein n=1 Tax=Marinicella meishanensis TaxID=2873263 RepID=UPI001CC0A9BE|nr:hypothetical protein [Marinicella sp. NBU2979]
MNVVAWLVYVLLAVGAFYWHGHPELLVFSGALGWLKALLWAVFVAFMLYTIHCSRKENLILTVRSMAGYFWGRQIMLDLYMGLILTLLIIGLHQGLWVMLVWTLPVLLYGNAIAWLYLLIHFESLVAMLGS